MNLSDLKPAKGSRRKRKDLGRGRSSGLCNTCGRGDNGEGQRAGKGKRRGFEGGQTPLYRRLPKMQTNERANRLDYNIVNLSQLQKLSGEKEITIELLKEKGIIATIKDGLRILSKGEVKHAYTIKAYHFSEEAKKKIEAAGGKCELLGKE